MAGVEKMDEREPSGVLMPALTLCSDPETGEQRYAIVDELKRPYYEYMKLDTGDAGLVGVVNQAIIRHVERNGVQEFDGSYRLSSDRIGVIDERLLQDCCVAALRYARQRRKEERLKEENG